MIKSPCPYLLNNYMNVIDYELIENVSILFNSQIILYGTGYWAEKTYSCMEEIGIHLQMVCQTNVVEKRFHQWKVKSLLEVLNEYDKNNYLMIIASIDYYEEMLKSCSRSKNMKICTLYGFYTSIRLHIREHILPEKFSEKVEMGNQISRYLFFQGIKRYAIEQFAEAALAPEECIWIFQPGKVGSKSIWNSMQNKSIHLHSLTTACRLIDAEEEYLKYYMQLIYEKKIKIITAVREPISRDIAAFFQNSDLGFWPYNHFNDNILWMFGDINNSLMNIDTAAMKDRCPQWRDSLNKSFEDLAYTIIRYKMDLFSWFDYEIGRVFGIDVYSYPFHKESGYTIIEKDNVQILILKMEYLSALESVIRDFVGDNAFKLCDSNRAEGKIYRYAYDKFKMNIRIPVEYFDFYYDKNYKYEHFYSKEEIENNYQKWRDFLCKN